MNVTKMNYEMEKFNEENVQLMLKNLGFNINNYFIAMTKPSLLNVALMGNIAEFSNRYCIIVFSETELNLIMLSRINNKKVTEILKIDYAEISKMKLSNILISYMLNITASQSTMKFQVYKKVAKFSNLKSSIELFKKIYSL